MGQGLGWRAFEGNLSVRLHSFSLSLLPQPVLLVGSNTKNVHRVYGFLFESFHLGLGLLLPLLGALVIPMRIAHLVVCLDRPQHSLGE